MSTRLSFPLFVQFVDPFEQAIALLLLGQMEEMLDDAGGIEKRCFLDRPSTDSRL
jgi:hypothetical protein